MSLSNHPSIFRVAWREAICPGASHDATRIAGSACLLPSALPSGSRCPPWEEMGALHLDSALADVARDVKRNRRL
jgi:hypothetical protein